MTALPDTRQVADLLSKIAKLASSNPEPPQFFANFLQLAISASGSRGGAIWVLQPEKGPQCYCHLNVELCKLDIPSQQDLLNQAIQKTVEEGKTMVVPPKAEDSEAAGLTNVCGHCLMFKPLRAGGQVAMLLHLVCDPQLDQSQFRPIVAILDQAGETAETYLAHRRAVVLDDDRKSLSRLLNYSEKVHDSLDLEKVCYQMANFGREVIACERVIIWIDPRVKRNMQAVSGVDKPDKRAVLMQAVEKLGRYALREKKPIIAGRDNLVELPEEDELTGMLKNYFNVSQLNQIYIYPIHFDDNYYGVVVAEGFAEASGNLEGMVTSVANHGAIAIHNALEMASVPVVRPLARLKKIKDDPKRKRKFVFRTLLVIVIIVLCMFMPWTITIKGDCSLTPQVMRSVESQLEQIQIKEIYKTEGRVNEGELIAQLDDFDLKNELATLKIKLEQEKLNFNRGNLTPVEKNTSELEIHRINNEIELKKDLIKRCKVISPITGHILTPQMDRRVGLTVKRGDLICELADLNSWQLVIEVPQADIEWVRLAAAGGEGQASDQVLPVVIDYVLEAFPQVKLAATIDRPDQIAHAARITQNGNVFDVRIDIEPDALEKIQHGLRDGMEGSAKIRTVKKPLGFVVARKVIRFFRLTFF